MSKLCAIGVLILAGLFPWPAPCFDKHSGSESETSLFEVFVKYRTSIVDPSNAPHEYFSREFLGYFLDSMLRGSDDQIPLSRRVSRFMATLRFGRRVEVVHDFAETLTDDGSRLLTIAFSGRMVDSPAVYELKVVFEQGRWRFDHLALDVTQTAVSERGLSSSNVLLRFD